MKIYCETKQTPSQLLNSLGRYLFKNLAGATSFKKSSNTFEINTIVLYQIPLDIKKKYNLPDDEITDVQEMNLNLNITTYQNKLRFNIIEETPDALTLGCKVINLGLQKYQKAKTNQQLFELVMNDLQKYIYQSLEKRYSDYEFLY